MQPERSEPGAFYVLEAAAWEAIRSRTAGGRSVPPCVSLPLNKHSYDVYGIILL
jgi:hypothetical protein